MFLTLQTMVSDGFVIQHGSIDCQCCSTSQATQHPPNHTSTCQRACKLITGRPSPLPHQGTPPVALASPSTSTLRPPALLMRSWAASAVVATWLLTARLQSRRCVIAASLWRQSALVSANNKQTVCVPRRFQHLQRHIWQAMCGMCHRTRLAGSDNTEAAAVGTSPHCLSRPALPRPRRWRSTTWPTTT